MIRLFATDFDNTLGYRGRVTKENIEGLRNLKEAGVEVCICTGRMAANVQQMLKEMDIRAHIVATNGAISLQNADAIVHEEAIEKDTLNALLSFCEQEKFAYLVYDQDTCYVSKRRFWFPPLRWIVSLVGKKLGAKMVFQKDLLAYLDREQKHALKVNVFPRGRREILEHALGNIDGIYATQAGTYQIEVMHKGVNKWVGLQALAKALSIQEDEIAVIGDYDNDIPMIEHATLSFAVANAKESVKAAADKTVASVRDSGVREATEVVLQYNRQ